MKKTVFYLLTLAPFASGAVASDLDAPIIGGRIGGPVYDEGYDDPTAQGAITGNLEGSFNKGKTDLFSIDNKTWALRGAVNYDAGGGLNIQGDIDYGRTNVENFDFDRMAGTGHVYYRPTQDYAIGAFGQMSRFSTDYFDRFIIPGLDTHVTDKVGGLEAAVFSDAATFYGQIGYGKASWMSYDADHLMGRLGFRYFVTDNIRFDMEGAAHRLSYMNVDLDANTLKTVVNYRPDGTPVSVFAGYRYDEWKPSLSGVELGKEKNHSILAGLRFHFGSASLKDEEKSGPVWSSMSLLP